MSPLFTGRHVGLWESSDTSGAVLYEEVYRGGAEVAKGARREERF